MTAINDIRICLIVVEDSLSFPAYKTTTPITKVKSATLAPKITPKPNDEVPSSAAIIPIVNSGKTVIYSRYNEAGCEFRRDESIVLNSRAF